MRILLLHQYFLEDDDHGGSRWNEMAKQWTSEGHEVTVLAGMMHYSSSSKREEYKGKWFKRKKQGKVNVLRCHVSESYNSNFLGRLWAYFSFVFSSLWAGVFKVRGKYDVVLVTSPPLFIGISGLLISKIKRLPYVFEIRDLWPESAIDTGVVKNKMIINLAYYLEKKLYQNAQLINVLTPAFKKTLIEKKNVNEDKIIFIPNASDFTLSEQVLKGFDRDGFRKSNSLEDKFVITYVGAHGVANCLGQLLDAAKLLTNTNVMFQLIGDGMEKKALIKRVEDEHIENVIFVDPVPKAKVFEYIVASEMGASVLKRVDTFKTIYSNKTFDYMSCKIPILMAIDGVSRDLLEESDSGIYVEPENAEDIASGIRAYLKDSEKRIQQGINGYHFAMNNFDRQKLGKKYILELKKLIERV